MKIQQVITDRRIINCLPADAIWETMFKASFIGPVALIRDLLPALKLKAGAVVMVSGISSKQPLSKYATSNVLRTMWVGQVKTLADIYGPEGVHFNTLSLGGVITEKLIEKIKKEKGEDALVISQTLKERFLNIPLRKYAEVKEVVDMIDIYPLHLKMRFLTTHLASNLKRFSIEKLHNTTSIAPVFLNQNVSISGNLGVKISHLEV